MVKTAKTNVKSIGEAIRDLREANSLSLKELAEMSGVSAAAISRWETGKRIPTFEAYNKVVSCMGAELLIVENK